MKIDAPTECNVCKEPVGADVYDCRLGPLSPAPGVWAWCCRACFARYAVGTGIGRGQHYRGNPTNGFIKIS